MTTTTLNPREPEGATVDKATARLNAETYDLTIYAGMTDGKQVWHQVTVSVARLKNGQIHEIAFVGRPGEEGSQLDLMYRNLGIQLSRVFQRRDPATGKEAGA